MIEVLPGYPDDVLAISAKGHVTVEDYRTVIGPELHSRLVKHSRVRLLYELGAEYSGLSAGAAWSDMQIGLSHWHQFGRIAVVTDVSWLREAVRIFAPFFPHAVRVFSTADRVAAHDWIIERDEA